MSSKPIVRVKAVHQCIMDGVAILEPIDHPDPHGLVSNTKPVLTSRVIGVTKERFTGKITEIETVNTIYRPITPSLVKCRACDQPVNYKVFRCFVCNPHGHFVS
jgi:hypothetical protein